MPSFPSIADETTRGKRKYVNDRESPQKEEYEKPFEQFNGELFSGTKYRRRS